jgi:phosphoglycolate phosphatase-like HAD superfamily hydrolase
VAIVVSPAKAIRAVIFDLDETLLDRAPAWTYAVEEAVISVTGRRVNAAPLRADYRMRPWRQVLGVLLNELPEIDRCEELCPQMFYRSAMKRLLVHEGIGMALDHLRAARMDMGAVTREPHSIAIKQIQSTGLDRFLTVLSTTPAAESWDVAARLNECVAFLDRAPEVCAFVSQDAADARVAARMGMRSFAPAWAMEEEVAGALIVPGDLAQLLG